MAEAQAPLYDDEIRRDLELQAEASGGYDLAVRWNRAIEHARKASEVYRRQAERSEEAYENNLYSISGGLIVREQGDQLDYGNELPVNVYFGNIETQKPLIFSQLPIPMVRRRVGRETPAESAAAEIIQRCLTTVLDMDIEGLEDTYGRSRDDYLIRARGLMEVGYRRGGEYVQPDPIRVAKGGDGKWHMPDGVEIPAAMVSDRVGDGGLVWPRPKFKPSSERIEFRYLDPMEVLIHPARRWEDVQWVAVLEQPTRRELELRFGRRAAGRARYTEGQVDSLDHTGQGMDPESPQRDTVRRARVWRILDRVNRRLIFLADTTDRGGAGKDIETDESDDPSSSYAQDAGGSAVIAIENDQLGLPDFFPLPKPVQTVESNRRLDPIPEFIQYEALFWELQEALYRFFYVTRGVRVVAISAGQYQGTVEQIFADHPGPRTVPLTEQLPAGTRADDILSWVPLETITTALTALAGTIRDLKALLFEVSGIPDIMRGQSQSRETATVGRQKVEFGAERISEKKRRFARFVRSSLRIAAHIVATRFSWQTIAAMSGMQIREQADIQKEVAQLQQGIQQAQERARQQMEAAAAQAPPGAQPPAPPVPEMDAMQRRLGELESEPNRVDVESILRSDLRRIFTVDIETDSTIVADQQAERASQIGMMEAVGHAAQTLLPMLQEGFLPKKFGARFFARALQITPRSRELVDELLKYEPPPPAPAPPPPEQIRADAAVETKRMEIEHDADQQAADRRVRMAISDRDAQIALGKLLLAATDQEREAARSDADRAVNVLTDLLKLAEQAREADDQVAVAEGQAQQPEAGAP